MSDNPMEVVIAAFNDEKTADEALKALKDAKRAGLIDIKDAAVLRRDAKNKLRIKETGDMSGRKGAALGAVAGGVIGLLAGPVVLVGATGALIGGLAAKLRDSGFSNQRLNQLGAGLTPGSSAIVAVIEHTWVEKVQAELAKTATDVLVQELSADIAAQLEAGKDVAYTALAMQGALAAGRTTVDEEDTVEVSGLIVTEEGLVAGEVTLTPEKEAADEPAAEQKDAPA